MTKPLTHLRGFFFAIIFTFVTWLCFGALVYHYQLAFKIESEIIVYAPELLQVLCFAMRLVVFACKIIFLECLPAF